MILENAVISIKSIQGYSSEEEDNIEFSSDGFYKLEEGVARLGYFESEVTGMIGTKTEMIVSKDEVIVNRTGTVTSRMVFKEGLRDSFIYSTPYGNANIGLETRKIVQHFGPDGGEVEIDYVVNMEHTIVITNRFHISVKRIGDKSHG